MGDSRSLVGEADGVSLVEDRHDDFIEAGVDEILRNLADGGVGDGSAASLRIVDVVDASASIYSLVGPGGISMTRGALRRSS